MNAQKRHEIFSRLRDANPAPMTELKYSTPFELLVAFLRVHVTFCNIELIRTFPRQRTCSP